MKFVAPTNQTTDEQYSGPGEGTEITEKKTT
jgi:hypothetical protein